MKAAIVILNWNGKQLFDTFLPSVIAHAGNVPVIIADNASTDGSLEYLSENYPSVQLLPMDKNRGFAGGYNEALNQVDTDLYVIMNSDIETSEGWLKPLLTFMENHPEYAAVQPKIKAHARKDHFEHAGACGGFLDKNGYPFCRGRVFDHIEEDTGQYSTATDIFWASGACSVYRAEAFHEVGGFDEDFFAHMEEIDLCWRLQLAGHKLRCLPESTVYHLGGGTLNYMSPKKAFLNFRNSLFMITKNYQQGSLAWLIFKRLVLDGIAGVRFLTQLKPTFFWMVLKAHFQFYGKLRGLLKKRKQVVVRSHDIRGIYRKNIVLQYFVKKKRTFSELDQDLFS